MKKNVTPAQLIDRLVNVFSTPELFAEYNPDSTSTNTLRDGICGWCGVMAPLNRAAYVEDFGAGLLAVCEARAREIVAERAAMRAASHYAAHLTEARENLGTVPTADSFHLFAPCWLKNEGRGLRGAIESLIWEEEQDGARTPEVLKVCKVWNVTAAEFNDPATPDRLCADGMAPGGCESEDLGAVAKDDEGGTYYTLAAAVVDPDGRFFFIDSEGYNYARYILVPADWRRRYADTVQDIEEANEAARRAEEERAAAEKAERLADYNARADKWQHLMQDVRPLVAAEKEARDAVHALDWRSRSKDCPEVKALKAAERKAHNARRANILAMCRAAFPGVSFSLRKYDGWGQDWELTWTDGPTEAEFFAAVDLDLFCFKYDTFDGMTDYADVEYMEFTTFAEYAMTGNGGNVKASREMSKEAQAAIVAEVVAVAPVLDSQNVHGYYNPANVSDTDRAALCAAFSMTEGDLFPALSFRFNVSADEIARQVFERRSYYTAPTTPEPTDPKGRTRKASQSADTTTATAEPTEGAAVPAVAAVASPLDAAPAEGLQLITTGAGVAIVGDSRTTYRNRAIIKAHGARWNKTAQQWQATDPETVAALRAWFAVDHDAEPATAAPVAAAPSEDVETATEPENVANVADGEALTAYDVTAAANAARVLMLRKACHEAEELTERNDHTAAARAELCGLLDVTGDRHDRDELLDIVGTLDSIKAAHIAAGHLAPELYDLRHACVIRGQRVAARRLSVEEFATLYGLRPEHAAQRVAHLLKADTPQGAETATQAAETPDTGATPTEDGHATTQADNAPTAGATVATVDAAPADCERTPQRADNVVQMFPGIAPNVSRTRPNRHRTNRAQLAAHGAPLATSEG